MWSTTLGAVQRLVNQGIDSDASIRIRSKALKSQLSRIIFCQFMGIFLQQPRPFSLLNQSSFLQQKT